MIKRPAARFDGRYSRSRKAAVVILAALALIQGCSRATPDDPSVLALFDGGEIRVRDLDRAILALPPEERHNQIQSPEQLETIVRRLAFKRIMKNRLEKDGVADCENLPIIRDALARKATLDLYFREFAHLDPINPGDLDVWLESHPELRHQPSRRLVYTCFRSFSSATSREATIGSVKDIRRRVENGEPFPQVAEQESESETRHRQGLLGWISPGQLAPQLDQIIFQLDEGQISEPITTRDGVHLFWVKTIIEGRDLEEAELRPLALPRIAREREEAAITTALAEFGAPEPKAPTHDAFVSLVQGGDPQTVVVRVGDWSLTLGTIRFLRQRETDWTGRPEEFLLYLERTETLRQAIKSRGLIGEDQVARTIQPALDQETLGLYLNLQTRLWLEGQDDRLRRFFEMEPARFMTPPLLHVLKLTIPLGADPVRQMKELETRCADPSFKAQGLRILATTLGGTVEDFGAATLPRLVARDPGVMAAVPLSEGSLSPPHREEKALVVYGVIEKRPPEDQTFEEAREGVSETIFREHGAELRKDFSEWVLEGAHLRLFEDRIRNLDFRTADIQS